MPATGSMCWVDEQAAVLAIRVAWAASAWFKGQGDVAAYERLVAAVAAWDRYCQPVLDTDELLDELADRSPPAQLGQLLTGGDPRQIYQRLRESLPPGRPDPDHPGS